MLENNFNKKPIFELDGMDFFVPSYQRGYRWTKYEVEALLEDIWNCDTQYCIQPLIVKLRKGGKYEVVDGQQRLTTIYIFMKIVEGLMPTAKPIFTIEYETRNQSKDYLENLPNGSNNSETNIDFHYMQQAYQTMWNWVEERSDGNNAKIRTRITKLNDKIINDVFFIWYEIPAEADSIDMFSKVNIGKIPLTDAELIKALLLNKENFTHESVERFQTEISVSWDKTEQELHHDSLWYFLNDFNEHEDSGTRIDIIFKLLAIKYNIAFDLGISPDQPHFSFVVLSGVLAQSESKKSASEIWRDAESIFEELCSWHDDYKKYHLIGYLLSQKRNVLQIQKMINGKGKKEALKALLKEAEKDCPRDKNTNEIELNSLYYGKDSLKIRKVLLMFNIASLICESDRQTRFPFDIYKKEKWDLEHIHATADNTGEADDSLQNLTLLNARINRDYKDAPFAEKRKTIIEYEKKGDFIPLCTKNVFLKYYTKDIQGNDHWDENDKTDYIEKIKTTLENFFAGDWITKE